MNEYRVLTKAGRVVFVTSKPILDIGVADAVRVLHDFRDEYNAPHSIEHREYRADDWHSVVPFSVGEEAQ